MRIDSIEFCALRGTPFDPVEPYAEGRLQRGEIHELHWEMCGNPDGIPIVFLHGGPGAGTPVSYRRHFDPTAYRMVFFDQRGAGRSTPLGELRENNTEALIADIEALREHLRIDRWVVAGASWGSTLALAYGQHHAERCLGFLLRGIFLGTAPEIDWFLHGARSVFPEAWQRFADAVSREEGEGILSAYRRVFEDPNPKRCLEAAIAWSRYEGACSTLLQQPEVEAAFMDATLALGMARIEARYFDCDAFLKREALLADIDRIRHLPAIIVQGRYDMVCPIVTADRLATRWPEAAYAVIPDGGHSGMDTAMCAAQIRAGEWLRRVLVEG